MQKRRCECVVCARARVPIMAPEQQQQLIRTITRTQPVRHRHRWRGSMCPSSPPSSSVSYLSRRAAQRSSPAPPAWIRITPLICPWSGSSVSGSRARYRPYRTSQVRAHEIGSERLHLSAHACLSKPVSLLYRRTRAARSCAHPMWTRSHFTLYCTLIIYEQFVCFVNEILRYSDEVRCHCALIRASKWCINVSWYYHGCVKNVVWLWCMCRDKEILTCCAD